MIIKRKSIIRFAIVMLVFIAGLITLLINHIHNWWIWGAYITVWTWVEGACCKDYNIKWWNWVIIIGLLFIVDILLIYLTL